MIKVAVHVPSMLRNCCGGNAELVVAAATVSDVLLELRQRYPELYRSVCDETGSVRRHVNVFLNSTLVRGEVLGTTLAAGDVITIMPSVSGG